MPAKGDFFKVHRSDALGELRNRSHHNPTAANESKARRRLEKRNGVDWKQFPERCLLRQTTSGDRFT